MTGLRERKKTRTRQAIREAAHRLIEEQGYEATTVEQIAERAEVSASTVFRYFPAKEDIVLTDGYDPVLLAELRARPAGEPWARSLRYALRRAVERALADGEALRLRTRLLAEVPALRSRMTESMADTARLLSRVIADRTGRDPESLEVRVHVMSLLGALTETSAHWAEHGHRDDLGALLDRTLDVLERGPAALDEALPAANR
ncbi:TetR/AcrR family transcriptional regulator [Streptomyces griseosporeus]|uniref:TetR/AcrR family transcriptional regulator n=1 Tax=Streptomyces griseosporeus TaxID=1910 RepID=UPI0037A05A0E